MDPSRDYYATLGVEPSADAAVIRAAYRVLAQRHHPDKAASSAAAVARMVELNEAYRVLADPTTRTRYDRSREPARAGRDPGPIPQGPSRATTGTAPETRRHRGPRLRGISVERYAHRHGLSTEEVVEMIRCGDLPGFRRRGVYYVLPTWRRESVTLPGGDPAGCLLALVATLVVILAGMALFLEE